MITPETVSVDVNKKFRMYILLYNFIESGINKIDLAISNSATYFQIIRLIVGVI